MLEVEKHENEQMFGDGLGAARTAGDGAGSDDMETRGPPPMQSMT
jgi:hypothetical protein